MRAGVAIINIIASHGRAETIAHVALTEPDISRLHQRVVAAPAESANAIEPVVIILGRDARASQRSPSIIGAAARIQLTQERVGFLIEQPLLRRVAKIPILCRRRFLWRTQAKRLAIDLRIGTAFLRNRRQDVNALLVKSIAALVALCQGLIGSFLRGLELLARRCPGQILEESRNTLSYRLSLISFRSS